jgi:predicted metal-dependent HD superfamily phosphohydrolase
MGREVIDGAKLYLSGVCFREGSRRSYLLWEHTCEVERWAEKILRRYPEADEEVVLVAVALHDVGQLWCSDGEDHAARSAALARSFLQGLNLAPGKIEQVAHCIRAHRCRDVQPETLEAKILAAADSASHMTGGDNYMAKASSGLADRALAKLERDYRDIGLLLWLKEELTPLYEAWSRLLDAYPDWDI